MKMGFGFVILALVVVVQGDLHAPVIHSPISLGLQKHSMPDSQRSTILYGLKLRQTNAGFGLLEMMDQDVPLAEEVLKEKHLATYFGEVLVGNTPFKILFDTGSCEFWVPSGQCQTERCRAHNRFPVETLSIEQYDDSAVLNIEYLSGRVAGRMIYDTVTLGDVTVNQQVVGIADTVDITLLDEVVWDGILGLAYPTPDLLQAGVQPLFDNIIAQGTLSNKQLANQFAYYIDDEQGSMTFGGANCDLITPPGSSPTDCARKFKFIPVTEQTYWTVTLNDVRYEYPGQPIRGGNCPLSGCQAIVDTGTYLLYGPNDQVNRIISGSLRSCADYKSLPDIHFDFFTGEGRLPVTLTLRPVDYVLMFSLSDEDDCVVGISPDSDSIWTLGQVFLRSFYSLFDRDNNRIGFARIERDDLHAINQRPNLNV